MRRRKCRYKIWSREGGRSKRKFLLEGGLTFNREVGNVSKKGRLDKKGAEKIEGGCDPQRNRDNSDTKTNLVLTDFKNGNTLVGSRLTLLTNEDVRHNKHTQLSFVVVLSVKS